MGYFRNNIDKMLGYAPGEQPTRLGGWIKLNTNENPYPPSPDVEKVLHDLKVEDLRLYPNPRAEDVLEFIAGRFGLKPENVLAGNGSDDILTIAIRSFVGEGDFIACPEPTYSLYPVLASIQGALCKKIELNPDFSLPVDFTERLSGVRLVLIPRPNAPTGTVFSLDSMHKLCSEFKGVVLIDEAYADFSEDNCVFFVKEYPNVIISRTLSKSYSLANVRFGYAIASKDLIEGMMKVKDSYNVNGITQKIALAALKDNDYLMLTIEKVKATRIRVKKSLEKLNFKVCESGGNFLFASPPTRDAAALYEKLKENGILVRFFPGEITGQYIRISIGTDEEMDAMLDVLGSEF